MSEPRGGDERLPWLGTVPAPGPATPAATRARTPLLLLLALLVGAAIAVMAFLAGRTTAPHERDVATSPSPAPLAPPPVPAAPAKSDAAAPAVQPPSRPQRHRAAAPRGRPLARPIAVRPSRPDRRGLIPHVTRAFPLAPIGAATPRRRVAPRVRSIARAAATSSGGLVQLGAYPTMAQLDSAWTRLVAAYPYLGTMPRLVTGTAQSGRPFYYRLRVATGARREARALCDHLHAIGRGCMLVVGAK